MQQDKNNLIKAITATESRLKEIDAEREQLIHDLKKFKTNLSELEVRSLKLSSATPSVNAQSFLKERITLFRSLFRGREDVYPKLWTSKTTGSKGFDDPRLDTLFLTMPFSFKGKMVQYAGRLHRSYQGKSEIRIYDYVDVNIPVLFTDV